MPKNDQQIKILYIDDEQNNLNSFQAAFRRDYEIYTAISAAEGSRLLNEHDDIHVIIADQRMPGCTGVDFFSSIIDKYPDPYRILLTGYSDMESLINAINQGNIYRYVSKPWSELDLRNAIQNAYDAYQIKKELKVKNEELTKINEELSRFIYSASHDLRSPLLSVLGIIKLAKLEKSLEDPNGYLDMIKTSVTDLDDFILKIIEYYQSSRAQLSLEKIDFHSLVTNLSEGFKPQNPLINFTLQVQQTTPFLGDMFRITVVLSNLLANAVKYQRPEENFPKINVLVNVDNIKAKIHIEDNGVGILEEHLSKIFTMFFRAGKGSEKQGNGIGLYIVKEALDKMSGNISVTSIYKKGSSFELVIPNLANTENV